MRPFTRTTDAAALLFRCVLGSVLLAACVSDTGPAPPELSSITVTTATSGPEPDLDGYSVSVDGGAGQPLESNGSLTLEDLVPGTYSLALTGVADNCVVRNGTTLAISVEAGGTATAAFEVTCASEPLPEPPVARLTITTADGQRSVTEGGELEVTVPASAFETFTFDASRSEPGAGSALAAHEWQSNGATIGDQVTFTFALDEGEYLITLKVTNSAGLSTTASASLIVTE